MAGANIASIRDEANPGLAAGDTKEQTAGQTAGNGPLGRYRQARVTTTQKRTLTSAL